MIELGEIFETATQARRDFEAGSVDRGLLGELYLEYNPAITSNGIDYWLDKAELLFPSGNCGLASLYLQHVLQEGSPQRANYNFWSHTVLALGERIVDITADQFDGPKIYVGPVIEPWKLVEPKHLQIKPHLLNS